MTGKQPLDARVSGVVPQTNKKSAAEKPRSRAAA
jgi:hypothetical protein